MICEHCNAIVQIGDFPFCPHEPAHLSAIGDDIPGGFVQTNFGHEPETFYSKKAMLKRADELNLRPRDQWAGPMDKHLSNWASVSAKTLTDAKALLERVAKSSVTAEAMSATLETLTMSVTKYDA